MASSSTVPAEGSTKTIRIDVACVWHFDVYSKDGPLPYVGVGAAWCRYHGKSVPDHVELHIVNGDKWKVRVDRRVACCYEQLYLTRGYPELVKYYGLDKAAYKLAFNSAGVGKFTVSICRVDPVSGEFVGRYQYPSFRCVNNIATFMESTADFDTACIADWNYFSTKLNKPYDYKLYVPVGFFPPQVLAIESVLVDWEDERNGLNLGHVVKRDSESGFDLTGDWPKFVKEKDMKVGHKYCFKVMRELNGRFPFMVVMDHGKKFRFMKVSN